MQSKSKKSKPTSKPKPHISVYFSDEEKQLVEKAAANKFHSAASYIRSVVLPQAKKDAQ